MRSLRGPDGPPNLARFVAAGVWLVFLANPAHALVSRDGDRWEWVGLLALALFVLVYLDGLLRMRPWLEGDRRIHPVWHVLVLVGLTGLVAPGAGDRSLTCLVFVGALCAFALPTRVALASVLLIFAVITAAGLWVPGWDAHGNHLAVLLAGAAVWSFRLAATRQARLVRAEGELADLAVHEERDRIARDLHDILGHSLTVISVKSELAARMVDVDPDLARSELEQLQELARDALGDVRATTSGLRGVSLPGEIAAARAALEAAGIDGELPGAADQVPARWRELFAWTVREGVTNVVRHSGATRCVVELDRDQVSVQDDGRGPATGTQGNGLRGLQQRARAASAVVLTGPGADGVGFRLTVRAGS